MNLRREPSITFKQLGVDRPLNQCNKLAIPRASNDGQVMHGGFFSF